MVSQTCVTESPLLCGGIPYLDEASLAHCKGPALAVAIHIAYEGGICQANRGLSSDLCAQAMPCTHAAVGPHSM